jgi:hypothetical protein
VDNLSVKHSAWLLELVFTAVLFLGIATHEVYINGKDKEAY